MRDAGAAIVIAESDDHPQIADLTADFVYVRLQRAREEEPAGYPEAEIAGWARAAAAWRRGEVPEGLSYVAEEAPSRRPRDLFLFMINGAKVRAPAAAAALLARLDA